ncbi:hypothetical protein SY88_17405 [Clostridiales bacterium PH28_bin88]|nr:hypothetical protein SY88_17405 [Clostridiales bacterium PH28_bin88]
MKNLHLGVLIALLSIFTVACAQNSRSAGENLANTDKQPLVMADQQELPAQDLPQTDQPQNFSDLVKLNPKVDYQVLDKDEHFSLELPGNINVTKWLSPNEFSLRMDNEGTYTILHGEITENGLQVTPLLQDPNLYMHDILLKGNGALFISTLPEKSLYWLKNGQLKEYQGIQSYFISPLQKYVVLFPGQYRVEPAVINLDTSVERKLPLELDHGWPVYSFGLSFSPSESRLIYENWEDNSLRIFDLEAHREAGNLKDEKFSLIEPSWSPDEKLIAYLKWDKNEPWKDLGGDGRNPLGHEIIVYDLVKKEVVWRIDGKPFAWQAPIWSPNGKYILINMVRLEPSEVFDADLKGTPYVLNVTTGELKELATGDSGSEHKGASAWSTDNSKVLIYSWPSNGPISHWVVDIDTGLAKRIDEEQNYVLRAKKNGTSVFEIINLNNLILNQYKDKEDLAVSVDGKFVSFKVNAEGQARFVVVPNREADNATNNADLQAAINHINLTPEEEIKWMEFCKNAFTFPSFAWGTEIDDKELIGDMARYLLFRYDGADRHQLIDMKDEYPVIKKEIIDRFSQEFFGRKVKKHQPVMGFDYKDGKYFGLGMSEDGYKMTHIKEFVDNNDGTYTIEYDFYYVPEGNVNLITQLNPEQFIYEIHKEPENFPKPNAKGKLLLQKIVEDDKERYIIIENLKKPSQ